MSLELRSKLEFNPKNKISAFGVIYLRVNAGKEDTTTNYATKHRFLIIYSNVRQSSTF